MPSAELLQASIGRVVSQANFQTRNSRTPEILISTLSMCAQNLEWNNPASFASSTYPAANQVQAFQFCLAEPFLVRKVWWMNGTTATTNNADVGVYNEAGTTLIVNGGSTLIATANVIQEIDCTDTILQPGRYWAAYNQNGTTATPCCLTTANAGVTRFTGIAIQGSGTVSLGSTFTPAVSISTVFPFFGIAGRTKVA